MVLYESAFILLLVGPTKHRKKTQGNKGPFCNEGSILSSIIVVQSLEAK